MFALAIYDERNNSLFIARDRIGIKPLFYFVDTKRFVFGSEIKAILSCPGIKREIDHDGVDAFFTYSYIPNPKTIFKNISKLEPGCHLVCRGEGVVVKKYWDLFFQPDHKRSERQFAEEFVHRFEETVKSHMMSEVPLGVFLSGGIDSSLVTAFMSIGSSSPVDTFTIAFGGNTGGYFDERGFARKVAAKYHARQNEFEVQPDLHGILDEIVTAFDEPFADDSVVPTFHICRLARKSVTVALTGLGGDELFGGYDRYGGLILSRLVSKISSVPGIARIIENIPEPRSGGESISRLKRFVRSQGVDSSNVYRGFISNMPKKERMSLYDGDIDQGVDYDYVDNLCIRYFRMGNATDLLDKALYQDIKTYLPEDILALNDRVGMHHSMELRVPFVDHTLVEFCATIPGNLKIKRLEKKYLLKIIARKYVPSEVFSHPKQGFGSPMTSWLRGELKPFVLENLSEERLKQHNIFNVAFVQKLIKEHMNRSQNHYKKIFALIMFQRWYENYMI
jgi:asparagine synthase (glutamine-hydrolysing)